MTTDDRPGGRPVPQLLPVSTTARATRSAARRSSSAAHSDGSSTPKSARRSGRPTMPARSASRSARGTPGRQGPGRAATCTSKRSARSIGPSGPAAFTTRRHRPSDLPTPRSSGRHSGAAGRGRVKPMHHGPSRQRSTRRASFRQADGDEPPSRPHCRLVSGRTEGMECSSASSSRDQTAISAGQTRTPPIRRPGYQPR